MIGVLVNIGIFAGVVMFFGAIIGLIVTRKAREEKKDVRRMLWIALILGLILAVTPYALLLWAVLTI